jgi:hypothetical protein
VPGSSLAIGGMARPPKPPSCGAARASALGIRRRRCALAEKTAHPLAPPPCGGARFPTLAAEMKSSAGALHELPGISLALLTL